MSLVHDQLKALLAHVDACIPDHDYTDLWFVKGFLESLLARKPERVSVFVVLREEGSLIPWEKSYKLLHVASTRPLARQFIDFKAGYPDRCHIEEMAVDGLYDETTGILKGYNDGAVEDGVDSAKDGCGETSGRTPGATVHVDVLASTEGGPGTRP